MVVCGERGPNEESKQRRSGPGVEASWCELEVPEVRRREVTVAVEVVRRFGAASRSRSQRQSSEASRWQETAQAARSRGVTGRWKGCGGKTRAMVVGGGVVQEAQLGRELMGKNRN